MRRPRAVVLQLPDDAGDVRQTYSARLQRLTRHSVYQEFLARSLADKYFNLSAHMDKVINEANAEIMALRDKLSCTVDLMNESRRVLLTAASNARRAEES